MTQMMRVRTWCLVVVVVVVVVVLVLVVVRPPRALAQLPSCCTWTRRPPCTVASLDFVAQNGR